MTAPGYVVILNGPPRSGKSTIAHETQERLAGCWMNLGVDAFTRLVTPPRLRPGMGLRPGGERTDIEEYLPALLAAFYDSVAAHSRHGLHVVVDVGLHDAHSKPLGLVHEAARRLAGLPALLVGVTAPLEVIRSRRTHPAIPYPSGEDPVARWSEEVHRDMRYGLVLDTSTHAGAVRRAHRCGARRSPPASALSVRVTAPGLLSRRRRGSALAPPPPMLASGGGSPGRASA